MTGQFFWIWSIEHSAWWMPHRVGYTTIREEAGQYSYAEAVKICQLSNTVMGNSPDEAMVPVK